MEHAAQKNNSPKFYSKLKRGMKVCGQKPPLYTYSKSRMRKIFRKLLYKRRRRLIFHSGGNIPGLFLARKCDPPSPFKN